MKKEIPLLIDFDEAAHVSADRDSLMLLLKNIIAQIIKLSTKQKLLN